MISRAALSPTVRGMLWMVATGVLFTLLNAIMKKLAHELDPWLVGFLRYFLGALFLVVPALRLGLRELWPKVPQLQLVRGLFHAVGTLLWFFALPTVSVAEFTAIGFSIPLFICLGAVLFLGERMSGARWAAILLGFAGVLLVVDPFDAGGLSGVSSGKLLMLTTAPVFAGSLLVAKVLTRHERSDVMVLWQHLLVALVLLPLALIWWVLPSPAQWMLLVACGFLGAAAHYCMTRAFTVADISAVQPVKFLELIWAAILGLAMFGDWPGVATLAGGGIILASTLWLAHHESRAI